MFKTLIKSRFDAVLAAMLETGSKKKKTGKGAKIGLSILLLVLALIFGGSIGLMLWALGSAIEPISTGSPIIILGTIIASMFCLIGSIFTAKAQIFEPKDNELLLSMPIPSRYIFLSRMLVLLFINYLLEAIVFVPLTVAYGIVFGYTLLSFVSLILIAILVPPFVLTLSTIIAWIISEITSRIKHKTLISVILFTAFFVAYFLLLAMPAEESEEINLAPIENIVIFNWAGQAVSDARPLSLLYFALVALVPAFLTVLVLDKVFIKIITRRKTGAKIKYEEREQSVSSSFVALLKRELRRFFTSSTYIMNAGSGNILVAIISIMLAININPLLIEISATDPQSYELIGGLAPLFAALLISLISTGNYVSAPSISLEGKTLWLVESMPVSPREFYMAKIMSHIVICTPIPVISTIVTLIIMRASVLDIILAVLTVEATTVACAFFGMLMGTKFPKLEWQNENVAIKQGLSVFLAMIIPMVFYIIVLVGGIALGLISKYLGYLVSIIVSTVISLLLYIYFDNNSEKEFLKLR